MSLSVQDQYEKWPYPSIPLVASVPREHLWQLHLNWIRSRCGLAPLTTRPNIWIAGCGTFEPYLFSQSNPEAQILASDLSTASLRRSKNRLRWHGLKNVRLKQINLATPNEYPEELFDFIECYGVLMCLPNPLEALKNLSSRLKPDGILRIMVYPHYSRQRIFQIQKLAKLLGLHFQNPDHPKLLKSILSSLPNSHPLHYAFSSYWDAKNLPGIVDGFLHASDRGFTGFELCSLIDQANLKPAFCFHRPWGQPSVMEEKLSLLGERNFSFWLHYLDLWQSIRSNFTLCLTKKSLEEKASFLVQKHPLFNLKNPHLKLSDKARLLRLSLTGTHLPSRTGEGHLELNSREVSKLVWTGNNFEGNTSPILIKPHPPIWNSHFDVRVESLKPKNHFKLRKGNKVLNPLFDYLFDAYTFSDSYNALSPTPIPNLSKQIQMWENEAYPLENETIPFGLTPYGTFKHQPQEILDYLETHQTASDLSFEDFQLSDEKRKLSQIFDFLKSHSLNPQKALSQGEMRQLWILIFSYNKLFIS